MSSESTKRPSRTSMEGMIWNANHILESALEPKINGIPRTFFEIAVGLVIISVVEVGFIISGNVGTGIILKKKPGNNKGWSPPAACGLTGLGWGFLIGASVKDIMIFIMDDESMDSLQKKTGLKMGTQSEVTLGPLGRTYSLDVTASKGGLGSVVSIAYSKGAFIGLSVEGAVLAARPAVNSKFYGRDISVEEILNGDHVILPTEKLTMLTEIYDKLDKVEQGLVLEAKLLVAEEEKKKKAAEAAEKAAEEMKNHETIEEVNAAELAAKEAS